MFSLYQFYLLKYILLFPQEFSLARHVDEFLSEETTGSIIDDLGVSGIK